MNRSRLISVLLEKILRAAARVDTVAKNDRGLILFPRLFYVAHYLEELLMFVELSEFHKVVVHMAEIEVSL